MKRFERVYRWYRAETVVNRFSEKAGPYYNEIQFNQSNYYHTEEEAVAALEEFYSQPQLEYYIRPHLVLLPTFIETKE